MYVHCSSIYLRRHMLGTQRCWPHVITRGSGRFLVGWFIYVYNHLGHDTSDFELNGAENSTIDIGLYLITYMAVRNRIDSYVCV